MINRNLRLARPLGLAATAALGLTFTSVGSAAAASPTSASVANGVLTVTASSGDDDLSLRLAPGDPTTLQVDFGDDGSAEASFARSDFSAISVFMLAGNDHFRVDQSGGPFADEALTIDGGSGNDTLLGGDGAELMLGGSGNDFADGNRGNDRADLGTGSDTFQWDPGDGSDSIDGRSGVDTLLFIGSNAAEKMSLSANGSRSVFLRDVANIRMDMDNVEQLDLRALGGADLITVNDMTGTDFTGADIDLSATGGGGDGSEDTVTVLGSQRNDNVHVAAKGTTVDVHGLTTRTQVTGAEPTDHLRVNTGGGTDKVDVSTAASALIDVTVDLGAGQR